jgi:hypothetical protein
VTYMPCTVNVAGGASVGGTGLPEVHAQRAPAAGPPNMCMSHLLARGLADCNMMQPALVLRVAIVKCKSPWQRQASRLLGLVEAVPVLC